MEDKVKGYREKTLQGLGAIHCFLVYVVQ